ncbi:hypothetical protein [Paraglaciecola polaris]|uniref:hypothetical protein n=1 Tax=Paraglaciecola polaris TaxID=222814 RepID=UPI003C6EA450
MSNLVNTGANRGIGLAFVKYYLAQGHQVYALCRNTSDELTGSKAQVMCKPRWLTTAAMFTCHCTRRHCLAYSAVNPY